MIAGAECEPGARVERRVRLADLSGASPDRTGLLVAEESFEAGWPVVSLTLTADDLRVTARADDLFAALQEVRRRIAPWCPAVQGARTPVWPSPMSRDAGGWQAYDLSAPGARMVEVLDETTADLSTVRDQEAAFLSRTEGHPPG